MKTFTKRNSWLFGVLLLSTTAWSMKECTDEQNPYQFEGLVKLIEQEAAKLGGDFIINLNENTPEFACTEPKCNEKFSEESQLSFHIMFKHKNKKFKCPCDGCASSFCDAQKWLQHVKRDHPNLCPSCLTTYLKKKDLVRHMGEKQIQETHNEFFCRKCHKYFVNKVNFAAHMLLPHSDGVDIPCPFNKCSFLTRNEDALKKHINQEHLANGTKISSKNFVDEKEWVKFWRLLYWGKLDMDETSKDPDLRIALLTAITEMKI